MHLCNLSHFQGSEADTVVYGISSSKFETWQHVYTAVTRAKKKVIIVGMSAPFMPRKKFFISKALCYSTGHYAFKSVQEDMRISARLLRGSRVPGKRLYARKS